MEESKRAGKILLTVNGLPTFYGALKEWEEECCELWRHWNKDTLDLYTGFIEDNIAANLPNHNYTPIDSYCPEDFEKLLEKLELQFDASTVQKHRHIIRTVTTVASNHYIYNHEIIAKTKEKKKIYKREKKLHDGVIAVPRKSLNMMEELLVKQYLDSKIFENGAVAGLWLMYHCGLRNGEACGASFGMIKPMEDHPEAKVIDIVASTVSGTKKPQIGGKTLNSARMIYLSDDMVQLLFSIREDRVKKLLAEGKEIPDVMPIACSAKDVTQNCSAAALTKAARELFEAVGMRREELSALAKQLWEENAEADIELKGEEFKLIEKDPTAYLLRRNFATTLEKLNMTREEKEYLMGHRIENELTKRADYLDEKLLWPMCQKLMLRSHLEELEDEIIVNADVYRGTLRGKTTVYIPAEWERIKLDVRSLEPDVPINIVIEGEGEIEVEFSTAYEELPPIPSQAVYIDNLMRRTRRKVLDGMNPSLVSFCEKTE